MMREFQGFGTAYLGGRRYDHCEIYRYSDDLGRSWLEAYPDGIEGMGFMVVTYVVDGYRVYRGVCSHVLTGC